MSQFKLNSSYQPTGDQPKAISGLIKGANKHDEQVLLGVTGSGKTYTVANVIQELQLPTLVISHNKTLAGQLYQEFRDFFPDNAVSYFVSYYDYYQPEAYVPSTDTYIAKETDINEEIDKLRLSATTHLLTRPDCIVVASVSCIYNLGSPAEYGQYILRLKEGQVVSRQSVIQRLIDLQYDRSDTDLVRGSFRIKGETIQIWPAYDDYGLRVQMLEDRITKIIPINPISGKTITSEEAAQSHLSLGSDTFVLYPAKHYITDPKSQQDSIQQIRDDLTERVTYLKEHQKPLEAYRLEQRVKHDLEMIEQFGFVNGIENYSRYFDGRKPGDPPYTLIDYFHHNIKEFGKPDFLTIIDESHITVPQIRGMYGGDQSRKRNLIDYGFRLPSALDNRPLRFDEFEQSVNKVIYVSATPDDWEITRSNGQVHEQIIRPTGLIDPEIEIRPTDKQVPDLIREIWKRKKLGQRVLVTTLTKRMAEDLTEFLNNPDKLKDILELDAGEHQLPQVAYIHADVDTLDRADLLDDLRLGKYDVLVGINLLREGLDLPEVSLVAILDADKEGFLRSRTSLIQTMGRAARHQEGRAILYADKTTRSMKQAIEEVERRRQIQLEYNQKHNITPESINKPMRQVLIQRQKDVEPEESDNIIQISKKEQLDLETLIPESLTPKDRQQVIKKLRTKMRQAAKEMDFELAATIRDKIQELESY